MRAILYFPCAISADARRQASPRLAAYLVEAQAQTSYNGTIDVHSFYIWIGISPHVDKGGRDFNIMANADIFRRIAAAKRSVTARVTDVSGRVNDHIVITKQKIGDARTEVRRILHGAPDEKKRGWWREAEIKSVPDELGKDYQLRWIKAETLLRGRRGFFRLWQGDPEGGKPGPVALWYGHSPQDLEAVEQDGRNVFCHPNRVFFVKGWAGGVRGGVGLDDITQATITYSGQVDKGIYNAGVLYLTDEEKGVYRSLGMAYVLKKEKDFVHEITFYSDPTETERLLNPFGRRLHERAFQAIWPGIRLIEVIERQDQSRSAAGLDPLATPEQWAKWKANATAGHRYRLTREEAEELLHRHFQDAVERFINRQDPVSDEEKKMHWGYYAVTRNYARALEWVEGKRVQVKKLDVSKRSPAVSMATGAMRIGLYFTGGGGAFCFLGRLFNRVWSVSLYQHAKAAAH